MFVISLGLGSPAGIPEFVLFGLSPQPDVVIPTAVVITVRADDRTIHVGAPKRTVTVRAADRTIRVRSRIF